MIDTLHKQPALSEMFTAFLLNRNIRIEEDLIDQLSNSSEKRLPRLLLLLANFGKEDAEPISFHITQEILAEIVGITRSRVRACANCWKPVMPQGPKAKRNSDVALSTVNSDIQKSLSIRRALAAEVTNRR